MNPAIQIHDLTVAYHSQPVLWDIDLTVPRAACMAVIGPNGAGKSTLLKAILGLVPVVAGGVLINGLPARQQRQCLAYVPQRNTVDWDFPARVRDVVLMGTYGRLGWLRRPGAREQQDTLNALQQVGMVELAHRQIGQLSGGQQQRTFLARALVQHADILLLDEPFQGVDTVTERTIISLLHTLREQGRTILAVHHDLATVPEYFDHVALLNVSLIASGPTAEAFTKTNLDTCYRAATREDRAPAPSMINRTE